MNYKFSVLAAHIGTRPTCLIIIIIIMIIVSIVHYIYLLYLSLLLIVNFMFINYRHNSYKL